MVCPPPLRELQLRLRDLFARPLAREDIERAAAALPIRSHGGLSAAERVRVYADMYFLRLRDALAEDYAALRRALGAERFARLARAYADAHPSDRTSLRDFGRHLPAFLARRLAPVEAPWQAALAAFEWAMVDAFDAPDEAVLEARDLAALRAEAWPGLLVQPVCSLVLLELPAPVDTLRERLLAGDDLTGVALEPVVLRVWRQELTVYHRRIDSLELGALRALGTGASFASLCGWLADRVGEADAAGEAVRLLRRWLDDALLVAPGARLPSADGAGT